MKTNIITTIGPATESKDALISLINSGATIFRFNFTHGSYEWYDSVFTAATAAKEVTGKPIQFLLDTKGPEIRTSGAITKIDIVEGQEYSVGYNEGDIPCDYPKMHEKCRPGLHIQVDGGKFALEVLRIEGKLVYTKALHGGVITAKRHINLPGIFLDLPILSEKDKEDILFGLKHHIDLIAASFVSSAQDVRDIRAFVAKHTSKNIPIIAKIESLTGIENLNEIIKEADYIMIARGDLAVETSFEALPVYQRRIVEKCRQEKKPFIMATQLLSSMVTEISPTRAEASDIGNSVYIGAWSLMLSEETSVSVHPALCVQTMRSIIDAVEADLEGRM